MAMHINLECRRNGTYLTFESRQNGSRRNGSRPNGSRRNGSRRNGNIPCSHTIKTKIIIQSIQNQNSLLVKWQTDSIIPGGGGRVDTEVRRLVPSSHKRSERRHKIILHPDSLREKAI